MINTIFEVNVTTITDTHSCLIFGLQEAASYAMTARACANVTEVNVIDQLTGEVMLLIQDGLVTWVSGIGNPFEVALGAGE